jgi:ankyrin repeat protein
MMKYSLCLLCLTASAWGATAEDFLRTIRANDLSALRAMCRSGVGDIRDRLDSTPLHYAALYGSADAVRIVLEAGGDPNARNKSQATPVMYGAYDFEKTRLLVEKGGDVNAKANEGSTALWVAAGVPGNGKTVRYLIEKGANVKEARPTGADYLMRAAEHEHLSTVRLLLDKGLDPHRADGAGDTALAAALVCDGGAKARMLIEAGSDVNAFNTDAGRVKNGPIASTRVTPLMLAATCGEAAVAAALLRAPHDRADDGGGRGPCQCGDRGDIDRGRRRFERGGPELGNRARLGA